MTAVPHLDFFKEVTVGYFKEALRSLSWVLSDLAFPRHCEVCARPLAHENRSYLCASCLGLIRFVGPSACRGCANIFPGLGLGREPEPFCSHCLLSKRSYETCFTATSYDGPVMTLLQRFKFSRAEYLAGTLQEIFLRGMDELNWGSVDAITAVPLHRRKLKERGFNQAMILAQAVQSSCGIPRLAGLVRTRYSSGQTLQDRKARLENIRDSFKVRSPSQMRGKKILLVDDVMTTGATVEECSHVLKEAGAKTVTVLVLARA